MLINRHRMQSARLTTTMLFWFFVILFLSLPVEAFAAAQSAKDASYQMAADYWGYMLDRIGEIGWIRGAVWIVILEVTSFIVVWPLSKVVAGTKGTWPNALMLLGLGWAVTLVYLLIGFVCLKLGYFRVLSAVSLAMLVASFRVTRFVYKVSIPRTLGLMICIAVGNGLGNLLAQPVAGEMPWAEFRKKSMKEQQDLLTQWRIAKEDQERRAAEAKKAAADGQSTPTAPRPPTLHDMYVSLQKERELLKVDDPAAVAVFNEHVAAYNAAKTAVEPRPVATPLPVATPTPKASPKPTATPKKKKTKG